MKVGFSTSVCPDWDIHEIATQANDLGFYGVELAAVRDETHLPDAEDLQTAKEIDAVRTLFKENRVELVSLASMFALSARNKDVLRRSFERTVENIELAAKLGCPFVRVPLGNLVGHESPETVLARQVSPLGELGRIAVRNGVTLLLNNTASCPSSRAVWFVVDGVAHPGLRAAWDPVLGMASGESDTLAIPRLGARIKMVLVGDAEFDVHGGFVSYRAIGNGSADHIRMVDLLKGMLFDGYLMLDWPKARCDALLGPSDALPQALTMLLDRIKHVEPELTAYKKDKKAPNWSMAVPAYLERKVAGVSSAEGDANAAATGGAAGGKEADPTKPNVPKGGDPKIAALVAEAVRKARDARVGK